MGGSGGAFGESKQKASGEFAMSKKAAVGENETLAALINANRGGVPMMSQMAMNQFNDESSRQAMAMAASQRGASNPALAFRQAQIGNQQMGLQNSQQAALMAQQEKVQNQQMILAQAAAQRGVALQSATANQTTDANKSARDMKAGMDVISGAGQAAAMMASDENAKTNIKPKTYAMDEIESFLKVLKPSTYEYKDPKHGTGEKMGVMAQDLEKSAIGKTMVDTAPDGTKMVDTNKAIGAILAVLGDMDKKIKKSK